MGGITDFVNMENGYIFDPYDESEINGVIDFINSVTPDIIYEKKKRIQRTTTSVEHYSELMKLYYSIVNGTD